MSFLSSSDFWIALSQIILINIVLSGDNAVVIAMASRSLAPSQQKKAILFGSVGAIVLRVVLTFFAVYLLTLPYLKWRSIGGSLMLASHFVFVGHFLAMALRFGPMRTGAALFGGARADLEPAYGK